MSIPAAKSSQAMPRDCTPEQLKKYYNEAASTYDKVMFEGNIWEGAITLADEFADVNKDCPKDIKVLDLGCGTGILGFLLAKHGYTNMDGLDLSEKMIEIARKKNVYKKFICATVTAKRLDIPTGDYDAMIAGGAITSGYVKSDAMDEVARLVKPGGKVVFTIRKDVYDKEEHYGYQKKFEELERKKKWHLVKEIIDTAYLPGSESEFQEKCHIFTYEIL